VGDAVTYNMNDGYLDGLVRGFKSGILSNSDYVNLISCERLEDMRLHLAGTSYGNFLQMESKLEPSIIVLRVKDLIVEQFMALRAQAVQPLAQFLDYISYAYMIDNLVMLIQTVLHQRDPKEVLLKCHPLGKFPGFEAVPTASTSNALYDDVLLDTPLAPYFVACLKHEDLDELNIELIRLTLYKEYLEDFYRFCMSLGGETAHVMGDILQFEADRRSINITIHSFETELRRSDRDKLYPRIGLLYPEGQAYLARCENIEAVKVAMDQVPIFQDIFRDCRYDFSTQTNANERTLDESFDMYEVTMHKNSFDYQFHYGVFYSYLKLKEQELKNLEWISFCIAHKQQERANKYIPIFN